MRELFGLVMALSAADPAVPHILRAHYEFVESLLMSSTPWAARRREDVARGQIFGNAVTEIGTGRAAGDTSFLTSFKPDGAGFRLDGAKYYCTGTLYSDQVAVYASLPDERLAVATIPVDRSGVILKDDWDGMGQSRTGSGTTLFEGVKVDPDEIVDVEDDQILSFPYRTAFSQLFLTAIIAGILRKVVNDSVCLVKNRARGFSHAPTTTPASDPILQGVVGNIASAAFAAETVVMAAADEISEAFIEIASGNADEDRAQHGALLAAEAKVVVDDMATQAATALFEVGGASATKRSKNLDRHWRNIRTIASHNPASYKAQSVGDFLINEESLPNNGYF